MASESGSQQTLISGQDASRKMVAMSDKVMLTKLNLGSVNAGKDAWGRQRPQPAFLTIYVCLNQRFDSAAATDTVDNSTVHYGKLSKRIHSLVQYLSGTWLTSSQFTDQVHEAAIELAGFPFAACEMELVFPKASLLGDGVGIESVYVGGSERSYTIFVRNMRIRCLIGVNSNEREQKQMVVMNVWIDKTMGECGTELEAILTKTTDQSSFETLESLVTKCVEDIKKNLHGLLAGSSTIRIRAEKPTAVPSAEAAGIEIVRGL